MVGLRVGVVVEVWMLDFIGERVSVFFVGISIGDICSRSVKIRWVDRSVDLCGGEHCIWKSDVEFGF